VKALIWMGSSREDLRSFPDNARRDAGYVLRQIQRGEEPADWKPMAIVGLGVREIRLHEDSGEYRVIYLATRHEGVYVLHCFQKKTQEVRQRDVDLASRRFRAIPRSGGAK
jgi:phage-related protein